MKKLIAALCFIAWPHRARTPRKRASPRNEGAAAGGRKESRKSTLRSAEEAAGENDQLQQAAGTRNWRGPAQELHEFCLKGEEGGGASDKQKAQQQKMTDCNKQPATRNWLGTSARVHEFLPEG